jgi:hypothetical protein
MSLCIVGALAFLHLPYPFASDQALFTYIAWEVHDGARLYTDVWDIKQPGLFGFYYLAGDIFGFDEIGIHTFDLLWNLGLAAAIFWIASCMNRTPMAALAPLFCLGPFYARAEPSHLAQIEMIVGLPTALVALPLPGAGAS